MNLNQNNANPGSVLIENLRSFLHLTTQAPLELVCKSSLYLLTHVPATKPAVFEYIGTFYKVATYLHIRYIFNKKTQPNRDFSADINNINHINQVLDLIEASIGDLLKSETCNELWSLELSQWLIDLIGDIVSNNGVAFADTPGLSLEESKQFKNLSLIDALELWSIQCKPTTSILNLIRKCFASVQETNKTAMFDLIFIASNKYSSQFDWILCDLSAQNSEYIFENCLKCGYKDFLTSGKLNRVSVVNFFASNFANIVKNELIIFLDSFKNEGDQTKKTALIYLLANSSACSSLTNLILNEILSNDSDYGNNILDFIVNCDLNDNFLKYFIDCFKQIGNSIAVFDLISSSIELLSLEPTNSFINKVITQFLDEMEQYVYGINQDNSEELKQDSIPFLKALNTINSTSFKLLLDQIINSIKNDSNTPILNKLLIVMSINGNDHTANMIFNHLMLVPVKLNDSECPFIIEFRQEINSFHSNSLRSCIISLGKHLFNEPNTDDLNAFVDNLTLIYYWDLKNKKLISENVSFILMDHEIFVPLISQLAVKQNIQSNCTYFILDLYTRILKSNEDNLPMLKLTVSDLLICAEKFVDQFFKLFDLMDSENISDCANELNLLNEMVQYTLLHLSYLNEDKSPYRNILLRNLVDKFFEYSKQTQFKSDTTRLEDEFNEASNLFNLNLNITNSELMVEKSRFKSFNNANYLNRKPANIHRNFTSCAFMMNFAFIDLIEVLCSRNLENNEIFVKFQEQRSPFKQEIEMKKDTKEKCLLVEQMSNLTDLIVQRIFLEHHYIDYQWPTNSNESEDNFEGEVESIKLFIERDVYVQNIIENPKSNKIIWSLLEFLAQEEQSFNKCSPIIRSLLASIIIQWDSVQEQPTTNVPKMLDITLRFLNLLNKAPNLLPKPLCYIVDIVPIISSYETHISLIIIWRFLRAKFQLLPKSLLGSKQPNVIETKQLRYIFQKNISKLDYLFGRFFNTKNY